MHDDGPEIDRDAMRTTEWQVLISTFTAAYVTLYVALVFSPNAVSGWMAGLVSMVLAGLLAAMILVLFLLVVKISPTKIFKWTDTLIDWALQKQTIREGRVPRLPMREEGQQPKKGNSIDGTTAKSDSTAPVDDEGWFRRYGMAQLDQLNTMERHQDWITWTTNTAYTAINAILVAGMIALLVQGPVHSSYSLIGLVVLIFGGSGAFVSTHWFRIILRAHTYEMTWLYRAKALQDKVKVPPDFRIWQPTRPEGRPSWRSVSTLTVAFYIAWMAAASLGASIMVVGILALPTNSSDILFSGLASIPFAGLVLTYCLRVLFKSFFDAEEEFEKNMKNLQLKLGLLDEKQTQSP